MKIKCLVIDDEELARTLLKTYIEKTENIELVEMYANPLESLNLLKEQKIDLIFLDIQMPDIKGTDFAKMIPEETSFIFTTAYSEYALEGFELNAMDYLLKPITYERFLTAIKRYEKHDSSKIEDEVLIIKSGYDLHKLNFSEITHIESDSEYVKFYTDTGKRIMSYQSLKVLEKTLPKEWFMRIHRSYIINKNKVTALKGKELILDKIAIPVSNTYYEKVKETLF